MAVSVSRPLPKVDVTTSPYNAVGDGSTDDSAAFELAWTNGRVPYAPPGKRFAVNLVITQDNARIEGAALYAEDATPASRLVPFDTSLPVIQVGNDSNLVSGVQINDLALIGGTKGLVLGGGSYGNYFTNVFAAFQTEHCCKVGQTDAFTNPIQYNYFTNLAVRPAGSGTPVALGVYSPTSGVGATAANFFTNLRVSGTAVSRAVEIDSSEIFVTNGWIQVGANNKGIFFLKSSSTNPLMNCVNVAVDSDSASDNLVETHNTTKTIASVMRGFFQVNGKLKMSDGSTVVCDGGMAIADYAQLINPVVKNVLYLYDASQFDTSTQTSTGRIYASSGSLFIDHQTGNVNLSAPAGAVRITNDMVLGAGVDINTDLTTGTMLGASTAQKIAFHGKTPIVQAASANQAAVATTAATSSTPFGYAEAQANAIITLLNEIRTVLVDKGIMKGEA